MKDIKDYIVVMNNIMPSSIIEAVLTEYKDSNDWLEAEIKNGMDINIRNCQVIGISSAPIIQKNEEQRKKIDSLLFPIVSQALQEYGRKFEHFIPEEDTGYELLKYEEGGFYKQHTDAFKLRPRAVACSFALNDDFEGGEFAFFDRELIYKLKKGSCLLFPSNFVYPHEIMPVTKGTRYSIITWFV